MQSINDNLCGHHVGAVGHLLRQNCTSVRRIQSLQITVDLKLRHGVSYHHRVCASKRCGESVWFVLCT